MCSTAASAAIRASLRKRQPTCPVSTWKSGIRSEELTLSIFVCAYECLGFIVHSCNICENSDAALLSWHNCKPCTAKTINTVDPLSSYMLQQCIWAARYNTQLLVKLTPKGVVFSFLFFSRKSVLQMHPGQHVRCAGEAAHS